MQKVQEWGHGQTSSCALLDRVGRLCLVGCVYGLLLWGYAIAMQLRDLNYAYFTLAQWVPIRIDYIGEAGFVMSLLFAITLASRKKI